MKTSLIISVYKNVVDLRVVLEALQFQTEKNFEIIVSEDGESEEMRTFLNNFHSSYPIIHVTQPHQGWQKNKALNNAIRQSQGDYLIFVDGDCVLHHKFIENHLRFSDKKKIVAGKRVKLGPFYSDVFRENPRAILSHERRVIREAGKVWRDKGKFLEEGIYINPNGLLGFVPRLRRMTHLKGCNMSFYREAIENINGFDEDYVLPAVGEDIDLLWRFQGLGCTLTSVRNVAVQYHLYHKENWTDQHVNLLLLEKKKSTKKYRCNNGLIKF